MWTNMTSPAALCVQTSTWTCLHYNITFKLLCYCDVWFRLFNPIPKSRLVEAVCLKVGGVRPEAFPQNRFVAAAWHRYLVWFGFDSINISSGWHEKNTWLPLVVMVWGEEKYLRVVLNTCYNDGTGGKPTGLSCRRATAELIVITLD